MRHFKRVLLTAAILLTADAAAWAAEVNGRLEWAQRVVLGVPVSGVISEVSVQPGDRVEAGSALLKLDARGFQARVLAAKAKVEGLRPAHDEAQRELERAEELYERMLMSDHELMEAKIAFGRADAEFRRAEAELVDAEMALQYSEIRAPFPAVVLLRHGQVGQTVANQLQSVALLELAEAGRMAAQAQVGYAQVTRLKKGAKVAVSTGGKRYDGVVESLGAEPAAQGKEGPLYSVRVVFETNGRLLRAGQPAKLDLP